MRCYIGSCLCNSFERAFSTLQKGGYHMSIGIGAIARLVLWDDVTVIYEYGSFNLNEYIYRNENHITDGYIIIQKVCFAEPEIHEKIRKMPSGKKRPFVKRIPVSVDYPHMIENGLIEIQNCSNCWETIGKKILTLWLHVYCLNYFILINRKAKYLNISVLFHREPTDMFPKNKLGYSKYPFSISSYQTA